MGFAQGEKFKVCLINPYTSVPPFGIMSIAALLEKNGADVNVLSFTEENVLPGKVLNGIKGTKLVGISAWSMPTIVEAVRIAKIIRRSEYDGFLLFGGVHPTLFPREVIEDLDLDAVCIGEGELTTLDLAQTLCRQEDIQKVKGLYIKKDGNIIFTGKREQIVDVKELPGYAWHLIDVERYTKGNVFTRERSISLVESRGCPYRCTFCYVPKMFGSKWRGRTIEQVVEEMEFLNKNHKITHFDFLDDLLFGGSRKEMLSFCSAIKPLGVTWRCAYRINLVDEQLIRRMKGAGLRHISFGVESGSQRMLDRLKKTDLTPQKAIDSIDICFRLGIKTNAGFMVGVPGETKDDLLATLNLAKSLKATVMRIASYVPYPGTELYNEALKSGFESPQHTEGWGKFGSYSRYRLSNTSAISDKELIETKMKIGCYAFRNAFWFSLRHREFKFLPYYILSAIIYVLPDNISKPVINVSRTIRKILS